MKFRIGDKVRCTEKFLSGTTLIPTSTVRKGGIITQIHNKLTLVKFHGGIQYYFYPSTLKLDTKNQQLLFSFYRTSI